MWLKFRDLKNDITLEITFDSVNDMLIFFSKYNPLTVDVLECEVIT